MSAGAPTVLLTGATGFVGSALEPALRAAGWRVRCMTRDAERARARAPQLEWVQGDVDDEASCLHALKNCEAALYLVHGMCEGADYHARELAAADNFQRAAALAGVNRIVYLGGVAPSEADAAEHLSPHLRSRLDVGEALRAGAVPTVELRASMIVGHGSLSWLMVRDLAARLPFMVLPRWLKSRTEPVAIDDVVVALVSALSMPLGGSESFDLPGPEILSGRDILDQSAEVLGVGRPFTLEVPLLSPQLSSHWVRFVTRAEWAVAREIVAGLREDLVARDDHFWKRIGHETRLTFKQAALRALDQERDADEIRGTWGALERARGVGRRTTQGAVTPAQSN